MSADAEGDPLLAELAQALDSEEGVDLAALRRRYPERGSSADRLVAAALEYRSSVGTPGAGTPRLAPGTRLGDFEVEGLLARGGMGEVYRARQLSLGARPVALKVLPAREDDGTASNRFEREALVLASLHHPCLAEVYGFGVEAGVRFFAMRLVEGVTLRDLTESPRGRSALADTRTLVGWIIDVAGALAEVHGAGLVHRDVKPSNVVLEEASLGEGRVPRGRAVLIDFGLARPVDASELTRTLHSVATPGYAPPEQILGLEVDARADVFALGVTLHDLLCGRQAHERAQASAGLEPIAELVPQIDRDLAAIVSRAADPNARWRYSDAGELLTDLEAWRDGRPVSARRPPLAERLARSIRRHPGRIARWTVAAILVLLLSSGAALLRGYAADAAEARVAYEAGDVLAFGRAVRALPSALASAFLDGAELRELAARTRSADPEDPLVRAAAFLDVDDAPGALRQVAIAMRLSGHRISPILSRLLERAVCGESPHGGEALRLEALRLVARLFYERPCRSADELAASAPLRAALEKAWQSDDLSRDERLFALSALSALSGCGTAADASALLTWALDQQPGSEELRLGLLSVERIVRGSQARGTLAELPLADLSRRLVPALRESYALRLPTAPGAARPALWAHAAVRELSIALALAERATTGTTCIAAALPELSCEPWAAATILAASGERQRVEALLGDLSMTPLALGSLAGLLGDPELVARLREDLRGEPLGAFEQGLARGELRRRGEMLQQELDDDTLLGAVVDPARPGPRAAVSAPRDGDRLATWSFRSSPPLVRGLATGFAANQCQPSSQGTGEFLRFGRFGTSEVRLQFEIPEACSLGPCDVALQHLAAGRDYYPFKGEAFLEVRFDGKLLAEGHLVLGHLPREHRLAVPAELLLPGTHELSVRLAAGTTTTYRLYEAALLPAEG